MRLFKQTNPHPFLEIGGRPAPHIAIICYQGAGKLGDLEQKGPAQIFGLHQKLSLRGGMWDRTFRAQHRTRVRGTKATHNAQFSFEEQPLSDLH